jgi:hypothetical protein
VAMRAGSTRFGMRFNAALRPLFGLLGAGPAVSRATVTPTEVRVAMGWAFRARIPVDRVIGAAHARIPPLYGIGVHGWAGRWAVNGARAGTVRLDIGPPCRARVCGVPVNLRTLWLSLAEPDAFLHALPRHNSAQD